MFQQAKKAEKADWAIGKKWICFLYSNNYFHRVNFMMNTYFILIII